MRYKLCSGSINWRNGRPDIPRGAGAIIGYAIKFGGPWRGKHGACDVGSIWLRIGAITGCIVSGYLSVAHFYLAFLLRLADLGKRNAVHITGRMELGHWVINGRFDQRIRHAVRARFFKSAFAHGQFFSGHGLATHLFRCCVFVALLVLSVCQRHRKNRTHCANGGERGTSFSKMHLNCPPDRALSLGLKTIERKIPEAACAILWQREDMTTNHPMIDGLTDDARWEIALAKDRRYDGVFVTGVHSTGIYCRPSCPARAPYRKNVRFYPGPDEAEAAGLRACKRCSPNTQSAEEACVLAAIAVIREKGAQSLDQLADLTGYSPTHFQRLFKRTVGLSPSAFARALLEERVRGALENGASVTDALYEAGYSTPSQFYDGTKGKLGMKARDWAGGGAGRIIRWSVIATSLGDMLLAATDKGVCCLSFGEGAAELQARFPKADLQPAGEDLRGLFDKVVAAVEEPSSDMSAIPLDVKGTAFQERVWQALREIPAGETRSYGELAAALGNPNASRAVGGANGANNIAVLIPCHRVVQADGSIGGYAYGPEIKGELLKRERQN